MVAADAVVDAAHIGRSEPSSPLDILVVDTSALLCRYLPDRRRDLVDRWLASAGAVVVTGLARAEVSLAIGHALGPALGQPDRDEAEAHLLGRVADDFARFWAAPVDGRVIGRAAGFGVIYGLNLVNAIHLAAIEPLPRPATLLTFDDRQAAPAVDLGFDLIEDVGPGSTAHALLAGH